MLVCVRLISDEGMQTAVAKGRALTCADVHANTCDSA